MIQINEGIIKDICTSYPKMSIVKLGMKHGLTERRVRAILLNNNINIINPHKKTISTDTYIEDNLKRFPEVKGKHYVAIYKNNTNVRFDDYLNKSGCMTNFIKKELGIEVPSLFLRKKYFHEHGKQWHEQWFDIILEETVENNTKKCPYCKWETNDILNKSGAFAVHLLNEHGITREEHLKLHPEDKEYFALVNPTLNRQMKVDPEKYVICAICGQKFARLDWRHLGRHGLTKQEYLKKYTGTTVCNELHEKMSKIAIEVNENMSPVFISKPQQQIAEFIKSKGIDCILSDRHTLKGKEIDIYIPSLKIGIEYNGNFWHTEGMNGKTPNSHLEKTELAKKNGIKLIQIFEDEYFLKKQIVYNKISHLIHADGCLPKIMARKCEIRETSPILAEPFLECNHIQGFVDSTVHLGAFYNDKLIAVMSFKRESKDSKNTKWELTRFASDNNYVCQGIGGKLFKYFVRNYHPIEIKSFADRRWTINEDNNVYIKLGFAFNKYVEPNYRYYNSKVERYRRFHKFGFRKQALHKKYGFPLTMTENEMTEALGYKKIWDCGLIKYVWHKNN